MNCIASRRSLPIPFFAQLPQDGVEAIHPRFPKALEAGNPGAELLERLRPQRVNAKLRLGKLLDETRVAEDAQMLGNLGLPETEPLDDLAHRKRPVLEAFDDLESPRLRDRAQGR